MQVIVVTALLAIFTCCTSSNHTTNISITKDTVVLFHKDTAFVTGIHPLHIKVNVATNKQPQFSEPAKLLLILDQPHIIQAPEGVYEVYLDHSPVASDSLSSSQNNFVSLLDLYSFTAPGAAQQIEMDITQAVKHIYEARNTALSFYISLRFAPVKMPDGTFSSNAGKINFSGLRVVQLLE